MCDSRNFWPIASASGIGMPWEGDPNKMPKTWFIGSSVIFELVNDVLSYNRRVLWRHSWWSDPFEYKLKAHHSGSLYEWCPWFQDKVFHIPRSYIGTASE